MQPDTPTSQGAEAGRVEPAGGVYMASKAVHGPRWRKLRDAGWPIISTWIDEAEKGRTKDWQDLWDRCASEAAQAAVTVLYCEPGEELKGARVEVGAALSHGRHVVIVGDIEDSWTRHRNVHWASTLYDAPKFFRPLIAAALATPASDAGLAEVERLTRERDEAREIVARVNNSFGSYSFHTNPHPATLVEDLKERANKEWRRANAAEAQVATLSATIARLQAKLAAHGEGVTAELRHCGYCRAWHDKPCGSDCCLQPDDPTWEQESARIAAAPAPASDETGGA